MQIKQFITIQIFVVIIILVTLEGVAYLSLVRSKSAFPFLLNVRRSTEISDAQKIGFDEINPLWGWNMSDSNLWHKGYATADKTIQLKYGNVDDTTLRIFITGGSTSDLCLDPQNWPSYLHVLLSENNIPHTIYVAAVGGFYSSQEYLRLIEQGLKLRPHFHISYSGANETGDYGYITQYEKDFYEMALGKSQTTFFFPNLVYFLRNKVQVLSPKVQLSNLTLSDPATQFQKNLLLMQGAAKQFKYTHIGVLQPLNGIGSYRQKKDLSVDTTHICEYRKYYPEVQRFIASYNGTLFDYTSIFDSDTFQVYKDDCHVLPNAQKVIGKKIFDYIRVNTKYRHDSV